MIGKVHLLLLRLLRPFYWINNKYLFMVGEVFRQVLVFIFKCDISPVAKVPLSTHFPHYIGIVIGACEMGEHCTIRNNVTIGKKTVDEKYLVDKGKKITLEEHRAKFPKIGSGVVIGSNACLVGSITIGDKAVIGAGSVVVDDVEPHSVYVGVPAKKVKMLEF